MSSADSPSSNLSPTARLFEKRVFYLLKQHLLPPDDDTQFASLHVLKMAYKANTHSTVDLVRSILNVDSDYQLFSLFRDSLRVRSGEQCIEVGVNPDYVPEEGDTTPLEIDLVQVKRHPVPNAMMFKMKVIVRDVAKGCTMPNNLVNVFKRLDLPPAFAENRRKLDISVLTSVQDYQLHMLFSESGYDHLITAPNSSGASTANAMAAIIQAWMLKKQEAGAPRPKGFVPRVIVVAPTAKKAMYLGNLVAAHAVGTGVVVERMSGDNEKYTSDINRCRKTNPDVFVCYYQPLNVMAMSMKIDLRSVHTLIVDEADNMFSERFGIGHNKAIEMITKFAPTSATRILSCLYAYDSVKPAMLSALRSRVFEVRSLVNEQRK
uniref:Helicase ATP-binding domain-containing protein n=1 Tax=Panagrellus redivivus TaxID=6233 RepID=A0A7E4WD11_PANRE